MGTAEGSGVVGSAEGMLLGTLVGELVGEPVGTAVGAGDGAGVGAKLPYLVWMGEKLFGVGWIRFVPWCV